MTSPGIRDIALLTFDGLDWLRLFYLVSGSLRVRVARDPLLLREETSSLSGHEYPSLDLQTARISDVVRTDPPKFKAYETFPLWTKGSKQYRIQSLHVNEQLNHSQGTANSELKSFTKPSQHIRRRRNRQPSNDEEKEEQALNDDKHLNQTRSGPRNAELVASIYPSPDVSYGKLGRFHSDAQ